MKILAIADIEEKVLYEETQREKIGDVDLIISCGDLPSDYLSYISTIYKAPLFFVRGNHDTQLLSAGPIGENLHDRFIKYRGIRMLGFEGVPMYTQFGAVQYSEAEMNLLVMKAYFKSFFLGRPDIIVTHAPPKGVYIGDEPDYAHRGFSAFTRLTNRLKPKYFLYGHNQAMYHLNYGRKRYTHLFNAADHKDPRIPWTTELGSTIVIMVFGFCVLNY